MSSTIWQQFLTNFQSIILCIFYVCIIKAKIQCLQFTLPLFTITVTGLVSTNFAGELPNPAMSICTDATSIWGGEELSRAMTFKKTCLAQVVSISGTKTLKAMLNCDLSGIKYTLRLNSIMFLLLYAFVVTITRQRMIYTRQGFLAEYKISAFIKSWTERMMIAFFAGWFFKRTNLRVTKVSDY